MKAKHVIGALFLFEIIVASSAVVYIYYKKTQDNSIKPIEIIKKEHTEYSYQNDGNGLYSIDNGNIVFKKSSEMDVYSFKSINDLEYLIVNVEIYSHSDTIIKTQSKTFNNVVAYQQYDYVIFEDFSLSDILLAKSYKITSITYKHK